MFVPALDNFPGIFGTLEKSFLKIFRVVRRLGSPENAVGKSPGFDSRRSAYVQQILLDVIDDDEEEEEDDGDGDDEGNEDKDEDEFEDDKGR